MTEDLTASEKSMEEHLTLKEEKMELFRKVHVLDETAKIWRL